MPRVYRGEAATLYNSHATLNWSQETDLPATDNIPAPAAARSAYIYWIAGVAATAGLLFGFDIAVINGALVFLRQQLHLTEFGTEIAASSLLLGCAAGAGIAGWLSDRFGRRRVLLLAAALFGVSSLAAALPRNLNEFVAARLLAGLATGIASVLAPLYISENAPAGIRGRLVTFDQLAIVAGILLSYVVNWSLAGLGPSSWRWMFAAAAVPAAGLGLALLFVPESARWLVKEGRRGEALAVLTQLQGAQQAGRELAEIEQAVREEAGSFWELFSPGLRRPLGLALALAVLQQITGVNTVFYYGSLIFQDQVKSSSSAALGLDVYIGLVNLLVTLVAIWVIDRLGRKPLLMLSSGGMAVCLLFLGLEFHAPKVSVLPVLLLMLAYVASFGIGLGPGVWVVLSELFPTRLRGRAMGLATVCLWLASLLLTLTFLSLVSALGPAGAFWIYAGLSLFTCWLVWRGLPETKARSLEQIEQFWKTRRR